MSDDYIKTKAELMAHIERDWAALQTYLSGLTNAQLTQVQNPDGWTVKDHIAHLDAWERSMIAFLTGQPRHTGLGVAEDLYLTYDWDAINVVIFEQHRERPLTDVQAQFEQTHRQLLELLKPLGDDDLLKPYAYYLPDELKDEDGPPTINTVYGNTAYHYREHQGWIEEMLAE